ncbi:MAG: cupredoxin domain-containing protein [Potamolinea sp.]
MKKSIKNQIFGGIITLSFLLGIPAVMAAAEQPVDSSTPTNQYRQIQQPLSLKIGVTVGGLALIGAEVWWFLLKKPKTKQAQLQAGIQELTVTVDGGYEPNYIVVEAGQPVRLNFFRKDANSCLDEVLLPDFGIATNLPLNTATPVEFTPQKPGEYQFTCGMRMFRGILEVKEAIAASK